MASGVAWRGGTAVDGAGGEGRAEAAEADTMPRSQAHSWCGAHVAKSAAGRDSETMAAEVEVALEPDEVAEAVAAEEARAAAAEEEVDAAAAASEPFGRGGRLVRASRREGAISAAISAWRVSTISAVLSRIRCSCVGEVLQLQRLQRLRRLRRLRWLREARSRIRCSCSSVT